MLYGDPEDFTINGGMTYPASWDLPPSAIPRGNILNVKGDPLTPRYPSKGEKYPLIYHFLFSFFRDKSPHHKIH